MTDVWAGMGKKAWKRRQAPSAEHVEQMAVAEFLEKALRAPTFWTAIDHATRSAAEAGRKKGMGVKAGIPDLFVFHPRQHAELMTLVLGFELKRRKAGKQRAGVLSEAQRLVHPALRLAGCRVYTVYSLDEIVLVLREHDIPLHAELTSTRCCIAQQNG